MKRTTAPGSAAGMYADDNPSGGIVGTLIVADDKNITQEEVCAVIEDADIPLDGGDSSQLDQAIKRFIKERSKEIGEIFTLQEEKYPVEFSVANQDTYFPGFCLTNFDSVATLSAANYPNLVPWLRDKQQIFMEGLTGELSEMAVTGWDITSNVAKLTVSNVASQILWLSALIEDKNFHGGYTNWRTVTLDSAIGDIPSGTYAITEVDSATRFIKFALTASNNSGTGTFSIKFYSHRIAGSTTTAREFSLRGLSLQGQGDDNGYFINGLRRRGYFQSHFHNFTALASGAAEVGSVNTTAVVGGGVGKLMTSDGASYQTFSIKSPLGDASGGGTLRTAKETHSPLVAVHIYRHAGRYIA